MTPAKENDGSVQELIAANTHLSPHRKLPSPETTKTAESGVAPNNVLASPPLGTVVGGTRKIYLTETLKMHWPGCR